MPLQEEPPVRVTAHDRLQLEVKSELLCESVTQEKVTWTVDLWFALPQATGIAPGSYSSDEFYEDLRSYMRLKTPVVPLPDLVTSRGEGSPLATLAILAQRARGGALTGADRRVLIQECKLLSAILKSQLREWAREREGLGGEARLAACEELRPLLDTLVQEWRTARDVLMGRVRKARCKDVLNYTDESLSVQVELAALEQLAGLDKPGRASPVAEALRGMAERERAYRRDKGWRTVVAEGRPAVGYVDQARLLKKYISSVLHLHLVKSRWDGLVRQGIFAVAAGLAMLWAVIAQILMFMTWDLTLQRGVSLGFLGTFAGMWVITNILKDRIKATTAATLTRKLPAFMSDRRHGLLLPDPDDQLIGHVSERMVFERTSELPPEVAALRTASARTHLLLLADQDVLRYTRQIELRPRAAARWFPRIDGLTDILRLNVWRWIRTYARARKVIPYLDDDGAVKSRKLDNLYYVDVIVRWTQRGETKRTRLSQLRLALNRRGLVAVEEVSST